MIKSVKEHLPSPKRSQSQSLEVAIVNSILCMVPHIFYVFGSMYSFVTQIGKQPHTRSHITFFIKSLSQLCSPDADSETNFSGQKAYQGVLLGVTPVEWRAGVGVSTRRSQDAWTASPSPIGALELNWVMLVPKTWALTSSLLQVGQLGKGMALDKAALCS